VVRRLGRSQQLLVTALAEQETVAVQAVVENHLGRRPTRSELHAAQRSAHLLAQRGGGTISHVAIRPGMHPSRLAISRPRQWPDDWLDQGDDADRREAVRWTESRRDAGTPPARFGRWQQVIMDALAQYELVGLRTVLDGHLGRRPAKGESTAAQRAARMMARSGQVRLAHVRVPTIRGRRSAEWVVIGRAEVDPGTITDEAMQTAAIRRVAPADRTKEALDIIVEAVLQAAAQVADVDLHTVDGDAAGHVAQALASPLLRLTQLRQSLLMRRPRR
jgi:hypothetical protein